MLLTATTQTIKDQTLMISCPLTTWSSPPIGQRERIGAVCLRGTPIGAAGAATAGFSAAGLLRHPLGEAPA